MNIVKRIAVDLLVGFATITYVPSIAAHPKCKGNPKVISACYEVHGRLQAGADTMRLWLWPVGRLVCIESASHLVVKRWPPSASQKHEN